MTRDPGELEQVAFVRTRSLDEHLVRITSYGDLICFDHNCSCEGAKASVIVAYGVLGVAIPGTDRTAITLGGLVAAVESHRALYVPAVTS